MRWLETHFNRKFRIYQSQWEKFKVSWILEVTNGNQDSFQWEVTGLQYLTYLSGKISEEAELNGKEGIIRGSFQWDITGLQYLAYLSGKKSEEAELNRKEGTTWDSFQQEISSLGVLNWTSSFQIHTLQSLCLSQWERRDNQGLISMGNISREWILYLNGNYKFTSVKLEVGVSGFMDILILNTYSERPLSLSMGKKRQPGAHFNWKSQVYNTWLISVGKYHKKLNSMGKKG